MRLSVCARLWPAIAAAFLQLAEPAHAGLTIVIDKSTQRLTVTRDGLPLHIWAVSTGKRGFATPNGTFTAFRMERDHFSREWDDAPMPHSIFFTKRGHAIHGYLDTRQIGRPASHGCVRLEPRNAATLFALVKEEGVLNTKVVVTGTEPAPAAAPLARRAPRYEPERNITEDAPRYPDRRPQVYGYPYETPRYGYPRETRPYYYDDYDPPPAYYRRGYGYGWD